MTDKTPFEIVKTTLGAVSIKDNDTGEILHNPVGPWKEANALYVGQSDLARRLALPFPSHLVLFDVGLGAGFNALAAISEFERVQRDVARLATDRLATRPRATEDSPLLCRPLHVVSFEQDLRLFEYCIDHIDSFPEIAAYRNLMERFLRDKEVTAGNFKWTLRTGSFIETIKAEVLTPEIIFFDPYSPKMNPEMWSLETFSKIHNLAKRCPFSSVMMTYSVATGIRTGMLLAGFFVGAGPSSGEKNETTFASTQILEVRCPLDNRWLQRWHRSHNRLPPGSHLTQEEAKTRLLSHSQWVQSANT